MIRYLSKELHSKRTCSKLAALDVIWMAFQTVSLTPGKATCVGPEKKYWGQEVLSRIHFGMLGDWGYHSQHEPLKFAFCM